MGEQDILQKATRDDIDSVIRRFKEQRKPRSIKDLAAMLAFSKAMEQFGKVCRGVHRLLGALVLRPGAHGKSIPGESLVHFIAIDDI